MNEDAWVKCSLPDTTGKVLLTRTDDSVSLEATHRSRTYRSSCHQIKGIAGRDNTKTPRLTNDI